jgi:hypothetical protein
MLEKDLRDLEAEIREVSALADAAKSESDAQEHWKYLDELQDARLANLDGND